MFISGEVRFGQTDVVTLSVSPVNKYPISTPNRGRDKRGNLSYFVGVTPILYMNFVCTGWQ